MRVTDPTGFRWVGDVYLGLPWWLRTGLAVGLILIGVTLGVFNYLEQQRHLAEQEQAPAKQRDPLAERGRGNGMFTGIVLVGVGAVLLLTCGRSDAERHGYNF